MNSKYIDIVTYADRTQVTQILQKKAKQIAGACMSVIHDKDTTDEGKPKMPHTHVALILVQSRNPKDITNWFKDCTDSAGAHANTRTEVTQSPASMIEYLSHEDKSSKEKGKPVYDKPAWIIGDESCLAAQQVAEECGEDEPVLNCISDIAHGMRPALLIKTYGVKTFNAACTTLRNLKTLPEMREAAKTFDIDWQRPNDPTGEEEPLEYRMRAALDEQAKELHSRYMAGDTTKAQLSDHYTPADNRDEMNWQEVTEDEQLPY